MSYEMLTGLLVIVISLIGATWKISQAIGQVSVTLETKMDALETRLNNKIDALRDNIKEIRDDIHKLDKRLHGIEVLYLNKPLRDPLEDDKIEFEEG